ncbi:MAG: LuxR C-terminal-related transcriptional regulator [Planctomycetota bacterium]|nr:LuxR C-terminal-related transcriptional regulator [Planctomycetota bacterium]
MDADSRDANDRVSESAEWKLDALMAGVLVDLAQLTAQQQVVLREFVREPNDHRIAHALDLRPQTVRNHLSRIQKKLKVNRRVELMKVAIVASANNNRSELG